MYLLGFSLSPCARITGFESERHNVGIVGRLPRGRLRNTLQRTSKFSVSMRINSDDYSSQVRFDAMTSDAPEPYESRKGIRVYLLRMYGFHVRPPS